jgi:hypothetical protein
MVKPRPHSRISNKQHIQRKWPLKYRLSFSKNLPDPEATQQRYKSNDKESKQ